MAETSPRYEALKRLVLELGYVRPGSLVRRFMPCGRAGCHCMADPPRLHGPYYQWSQKVRGKTVTRRLSPEQAELCHLWIENHRKLRRVIRQLETLSLQATDKLLGAISRP